MSPLNAQGIFISSRELSLVRGIVTYYFAILAHTPFMYAIHHAERRWDILLSPSVPTGLYLCGPDRRRRLLASVLCFWSVHISITNISLFCWQGCNDGSSSYKPSCVAYQVHYRHTCIFAFHHICPCISLFADFSLFCW